MRCAVPISVHILYAKYIRFFDCASSSRAQSVDRRDNFNDGSGAELTAERVYNDPESSHRSFTSKSIIQIVSKLISSAPSTRPITFR